MRELIERSGLNDRVVIGIVDDDLQLKGRIIAGHTVFGGISEIGAIVADHRIDGVIITCLLSPEKQAEVVESLRTLGVSVSVWACDEKVLVDPRQAGAQAGEK